MIGMDEPDGGGAKDKLTWFSFGLSANPVYLIPIRRPPFRFGLALGPRVFRRLIMNKNRSSGAPAK